MIPIFLAKLDATYAQRFANEVMDNLAFEDSSIPNYQFLGLTSPTSDLAQSVDHTAFTKLEIRASGIGPVSTNHAGTVRIFTLNPVGNINGLPDFKYNVTAPEGYEITPTQGTYGMGTTFVLSHTSGSAVGTGTVEITLTDAGNANISLLEKISDVPLTPCLTGDTGGMVWIDADGDGIQDATETSGLAGVKVYIYDCLGALVDSTVTDSLGQYTFGVLAPAPSSTAPYRIEFAGVPAPYKPTMNGADGRTDVQFISAPDCDVDFGVGDPASLGTCNTKIFVSCYSITPTQPAVAFFPLSSSGSTPSPVEISDIAQVGSLWGAASQASQKRLFFSAVLKRHVNLGPLGLDGVYIFDYSSGNPAYSTGFKLSTLTLANAGSPAISGGSIDVGTVVRVQSPSTDDNYIPSSGLSRDKDAFGKVGKVGIGDCDVNGNLLWLVNMNQKALISVDISGTGLPTTANQYLLTNFNGNAPACGSNWQPWGLGFSPDGTVGYVGIECTTGTLMSYVYSFDPANMAAGLTLKASFPMNYRREYAGANGNNTWKLWTDVWITNLQGQNSLYPQPVVSDIVIDNAGGMTISLLDRTPMQVGYKNYRAISGDMSTNDESIAGGDIVKYCAGSAGSFIMEGLAGCLTSDMGTLSTSVIDGNKGSFPNLAGNPGSTPNPTLPDGISGNGEFYWGDYFKNPSNNSGHEEISLGSILYDPVNDDIISTVFDPVANYSQNGIHWYEPGTGLRTKTYLIVPSSNDVFGKGISLGDMELACIFPPAPLQIGNYVWVDSDQDGTQDPCEQPLAGVSVALYKDVAGVLTFLAYTTTGSNGEYYFTGIGAPNETWTSTSGKDSILANTNYRIVFGYNGTLAQFSDNALNVGGIAYGLTVVNSGEGVNPDQNDSDASLLALSGNNYPSISLTTGDAGSVNHTYDVGFFVEKVALGNLVFMDTNDNGAFESGTDMGVDNVIVWLFKTGDDPSTATPVAMDTTSGGGFYLFDNLDPATYFVFIPSGNFAAGQPLENKASDVLEGGDSATDDDADENGQNALVSGGIRSGDIVLSANSEPIGETGAGSYTGALDDNNVNMTVDFSFVCIQPDLSVTPGTIAGCSPMSVNLATDFVVTDANNTPTQTGYPKYFSTQMDAATDTNPLASTTVTTTGEYWIRKNAVGGCWDTVRVQIVVNPSPDLVARDTAICAGNSADLSTLFTQDASTGTVTYYATFADAVAETPTISATVTPAATAEYFIRKETSAGCYDIDSVDVTINALPDLVARDTAVCAGNSVDLSGLFTQDAGAGAVSYYATFADAVAETPTIASTVTPVATAEYFIRKETSAGCYDIDSVTVVINPLPDLVARDTAICAGNSADLSTLFTQDAGAGTVTYYATFADAVAKTPTITATVTPAATAEYFIRKETPSGCYDIDSVVVTINALPDLVARDTAICAGYSADLSTLFKQDAGAGTMTYYATFADALAETPTISATVTPAATAEYFIRKETAAGCYDIDSVTVVINELPDLIARDTSICAGNSADLSTLFIQDAGAGTVTYYATFADAVAETPTISATVTPVAATQYFIRKETSTGCYDIDSVDVVINALPDLVARDTAICVGNSADLSTLFIQDSGAGTVTYYATFADALAETPTISATVTPAVTAEYFIRKETSAGCYDIDSVDVVVNTLPDLVARDTAICAGSSADLSTLFTQDASAGPITYYATFADAVAETPTISSIVTPATATQYFIRKETSAGCYNIDSVGITINDLPVILDETLVCSGASSPATYDFALSGSWVVESQPSGANAQVDNQGAVTNMFTPGVYVFKVTINGCSDTASITKPICCAPVICLPVNVVKN